MSREAPVSRSEYKCCRPPVCRQQRDSISTMIETERVGERRCETDAVGVVFDYTLSFAVNINEVNGQSLR